jgi:hypothetical protein
MDSKPTKEDYFDNKREDKIYVSRPVDTKIQTKDSEGNITDMIRPIRYISRIITASEGHEHINQGSELVIRLTPAEKQEIVVQAYEDTRGIKTLKVAKYNKKTGSLYNGDIVLTGLEIRKLVDFINSVSYLPIDPNRGSQQFTDVYLQQHILSKEQALKLLSQYPDLIDEISKGNVSSSDITELSKRKESLKEFSEMLSNDGTSEGDWQSFFEANTWIFGYGLNFVFNAPLEGKKLEQVVAGHSIAGAGKRVDAFLSRRGLIEATCFVEIKKHNTDLLEKKQYRPECYSVSAEVAGGVSQIQKSIQKSLYSLWDRINVTDDDNNPLQSIFNYQPKGYLVIGSLSEFNTETGINEAKYSSFELFRRNLSNPEIITFDELLERAKFIVSTTETSLETDTSDVVNVEQPIYDDDDLPF